MLSHLRTTPLRIARHWLQPPKVSASYHQHAAVLSRLLHPAVAGHFPQRHQSSYKAAILEEFDKPLVLSNVKNDSPLGTDMV